MMKAERGGGRKGDEDLHPLFTMSPPYHSSFFVLLPPPTIMSIHILRFSSFNSVPHSRLTRLLIRTIPSVHVHPTRF